MEKYRKLQISNYPVEIDGEEVPMNVRNSLVTVLFHPDLNLNSVATRRNDKIATKIEECKEDFILLPDYEFVVVKEAVETFQGYDRKAVELIRRVEEAEEVEVEITEVADGC